MKQNWLIILLIYIILSGCSSQSEERTFKSDQYSQNAENLTETESPFIGFKQLEVDGGDFSGYREANVVVDIGFGDREYWAFTNEYGQLVRVIADKITLQDDSTEAVTSGGRYYNDEADVSGTERPDMDKGHIIADSLGEYPMLRISRHRTAR